MGTMTLSTVVEAGQVGGSADIDSEVESICPVCGVGCQISLKVKDCNVKYVGGINSTASAARFCVKGRFGFDYPHHDHRLAKPFVRREDALAKGLNVDPANTQEFFREAEGEDALDFAVNGLKKIGGTGVAGLGSTKCTNEEAYLFQKVIRQGFGDNNVDHCTQLWRLR